MLGARKSSVQCREHALPFRRSRAVYRGPGLTLAIQCPFSRHFPKQIPEGRSWCVSSGYLGGVLAPKLHFLGSSCLVFRTLWFSSVFVGGCKKPCFCWASPYKELLKKRIFTFFGGSPSFRHPQIPANAIAVLAHLQFWSHRHCVGNSFPGCMVSRMVATVIPSISPNAENRGNQRESCPPPPMFSAGEFENPV